MSRAIGPGFEVGVQNMTRYYFQDKDFRGIIDADCLLAFIKGSKNKKSIKIYELDKNGLINWKSLIEWKQVA